jgi:hypothetical protein
MAQSTDRWNLFDESVCCRRTVTVMAVAELKVKREQPAMSMNNAGLHNTHRQRLSQLRRQNYFFFSSRCGRVLP